MGLRELLEPLFEKRELNRATARFSAVNILPTIGDGADQISRSSPPWAPTQKLELEDNFKQGHSNMGVKSTPPYPSLLDMKKNCSAPHTHDDKETGTSTNQSHSSVRDVVESRHSHSSRDNETLDISNKIEIKGLPDALQNSKPGTSRMPEISNNTAYLNLLAVVDREEYQQADIKKASENTHSIALENTSCEDNSGFPHPVNNRVIHPLESRRTPETSSSAARSGPSEIKENHGTNTPRNIYASLTGRKRKKLDQGNNAADSEKSPTDSKKRRKSPAHPPTPPKTLNDDSQHISGPARTPWAKTKSMVIHEKIIDTSMMSEWYQNINMKEKYKRSDEVTVSYIKDVINKCVQTARQRQNPDFTELRTQIHNMELWTPDWIKGVLLKKTGILEERGLGKIIEGPDADIFPWDIRDDAKALWLRWIVGDIDGSLLRGIIQVKKTYENNTPGISRTLDNRYIWKRSWEVIGHNGLTNGQWWPLRICTVRDGAHGELEAGISGKLGENAIEGAYSVVLADGGYQDQDSLNTIQYCSTESKNNNPTRGTLMLTKSWHSGRPIRVLRSAPKTAAKKKQNKYLPKRGIRYDGLYEIRDMEILNADTAYMRFSLHRLPGQDRVRWEGQLARPTPQQLRELMLLQLYS